MIQILLSATKKSKLSIEEVFLLAFDNGLCDQYGNVSQEVVEYYKVNVASLKPLFVIDPLTIGREVFAKI